MALTIRRFESSMQSLTLLFDIETARQALRNGSTSSCLFAAPNPMKAVRPPWPSNRVHHCEKCRTNALSHRERVAAGRVRVSSRRRPANRRPSSGPRPPSPGGRRTYHTGGTGLSEQAKLAAPNEAKLAAPNEAKLAAPNEARTRRAKRSQARRAKRSQARHAKTNPNSPRKTKPNSPRKTKPFYGRKP